MGNEFVQDERGLIAYKIKRTNHQTSNENQEDLLTEEEVLLYPEEIMAMLLQNIKQLAEKQAGSEVSDCVITVPSWFDYEQKSMVSDAAQKLSGLNVVQLVNENTAAAAIYGTDQKIEEDESMTVLFYNMGAMDTEVSIIQYSMQKTQSRNGKYKPQMEILSESFNSNLGSKDLDLVILNILADKFNELPEMQDKEDIRTDFKSTNRLLRESVKIKEILSANHEALVKVPDLFNQISLHYTLTRDEFESNAQEFFERVQLPALKALEIAGLQKSDIDRIELIGGGVRTPKIQEILKDHFQAEKLSHHLNGDEAMSFGAAQIAAQSSRKFRSKIPLIVQFPQHDVVMRVSSSKSIESSKIEYAQEFALFHTNDSYGNVKQISFQYDQNMVVEMWEINNQDPNKEDTLREEYFLDDIESKYEELTKLSIEEDKSRTLQVFLTVSYDLSGLLNLSSASLGFFENQSPLSIKNVPQKNRLSDIQIFSSLERLNWYSEKDKNKELSEIAKDEFESLIYKFRDWIIDGDHNVFQQEDEDEDDEEELVKRERERELTILEELAKMEEWLYEEGQDLGFQVYQDKLSNLQKQFELFKAIGAEGEIRESLEMQDENSKNDGSFVQDKLKNLIING